jgi:hypothetical protein
MFRTSGARSVLLLVVLSLAACSSGGVAGATGTPGPSPSAGQSIEPSPSAAPSQSPAASAVTLHQASVIFKEVGNSKITGGASLTDLGSETAVSIGVVAAGIAEPMSADIHTGTCANASDAIAFPLTDLAGGASNTIVKISINNLLATPYSIEIHRSKTDGTVVACADISS